MLKNECPHDEIYKSCSFYEEYTCWQTAERNSRVKTIPKRLPHCRAGCYCKKGLVRAYPQSGCVLSVMCRHQGLQDLLEKLTSSFRSFH
ncbi:uncharacterized protein LOC106718500 [Papilio machaon]|uniref:uncharacterized protein LOC106718500 n=1 Tax=Papilio machaon TaxID=76193 RepID=UPI001E6660EE|nr:uncharacterized protein LOC106718500 [Papilio machaon]